MPRKRRKYKVTEYSGQKIRHVKPNSFMADFHMLGRRERKCFETIAEAKTFIDQKKIEAQNKGREAFHVSNQDRMDIAEARRRIGSTPLSEIVNFWITHHPAGDSKTVEAVTDEFLSAPGRRGRKLIKRREATTLGHKWRLNNFLKDFADRSIAEITTEDIKQWLAANNWEGINQRHYLASVRALFNYAIRKKYASINPAEGEGIELVESAASDPSIMSINDITQYLNIIDKSYPELLPREAISFFCGLRPEELSRLDWQNVSLTNKLITVSGETAKIQGHKRHVEMSDNLIEWLLPYRQETGPVWPFSSPTTLHRKRTEAREKAKVELPQNAGRHAFASYHLALQENAPKTAELLGHSDIKLLKTVYRNITDSKGKEITKKAGERYFEITPKREEGFVVQFQARSA